MEESIMRNVAEWNSESDESTMKHQLPCIIGSFFLPFRITYWHYSQEKLGFLGGRKLQHPAAEFASEA